MSPATTAVPSKDRSPQEISERVQQRVQERNGWLVDGEPQQKNPGFQEFWEFARDVLPKFLRFQPPTQEFLDEHLPVIDIDWDALRDPPTDKIQMTWLGHASVLIQFNGCSILCDPVFSQRCAPSQWSGPKRLRPAPCTIQELCQHLLVDVCLISHNHYDHLDYDSLRHLNKCSPATTFVVPLGIKSWFQRWISKSAIVHEMDWHEHVDYAFTNQSTRQNLRITSVPMRHWSSRIGTDRDHTLWCGYSLATTNGEKQQKVLFPGDTAWFDGLAQVVGHNYGPFDVAAIPIGAYEPRKFMKRNHINVDEAVRMKDAIGAKSAVPIHWGTFALTVEPFLEPRERLMELMKERKDEESFQPWLMGETKQFDS